MGSGVDKRNLELTIYDVLLENASIAEARVQSDKLKDAGCSFDILGANRDLAGAEVELVDVERREKRIKQAIDAVANEYDFVLIDCPPSLSMLTLPATYRQLRHASPPFLLPERPLPPHER